MKTLFQVGLCLLAIILVYPQVSRAQQDNWTLQQDEVVSNTFNLKTYLNLNGHTLTIKGDLIHTAGQLSVNRGKLIVEGDYRIQTPTDDGYTYSSGYLYMHQADDQVVVQGDFVMDSYQNHQNYLTAGVLEIQGDFTQLSTHPSSPNNYNYQRNFYATGSHKVLLSGSQTQRVSFQYPAQSRFNILELTNSSSEGVQFTTTVSVLDLKTKDSILSVKSGAIQDVTLKESSVISSTATLTGNLNLNGQTLTIKGDLIHTAGYLSVNHGKLIVEGDYRIQTPKDDGYTYSTAYLYMYQADDQVVVQGDFVTDSTQSHQNSLTAGVLEIKGNFTQQSTHPSSQSNYTSRRNFFASGSHKVILSGSQAQQVSFQYASSNESHFNILELANSSSEGVQFATTVSVLDLRTKDSVLSVKSGAIQDMTLKESSVISSTATLTGNLNLNGQTLTIKGDLIHTAGQLYVGKGKLIVEGDYRIQTPKDDGYTYSSGYLYMNQGDDQVVVQGDFVTDSTQSHQNSLTAGVLEIKGNFTQQSTHPNSQSNYTSRRNFFANGSHKVILSGSQAQQVSFQYASSNESHFNILELANSSSEGVQFATTVSVLDLRTKDSVLSVKSGAIQDMTLKESSVISSTAKLTGNLNLNGKTLTIKGDLIHTAGYLSVNQGKLIVEGDYRIQTPKDEAYTYSSGYLYMNQADDQVVVQGDFVTDSTQYYQGYLTAGILEIKGNFTQQSSHPSSQSNYNYRRNFFASGSHKVILSGNQAQQVSFQYPASGESHFNILELANSSSEGVQFATTVSVLDLRTKESILSVKSGAIQDMTLKESSVISSTAKLTGNLNLNGQTLTIKGDLIHTAGQLYVNRGKLIVEGNYRIQTPAEEGYTYSNGYLYMYQADDQVIVQGDFVTDSTQSHQNYLTAGVLEIKGDLTQQSTHPSSQSNYNYRRNFFASGSHKVILSGNQAQQVSFQYPASGESHFNILELSNPSSEGVQFATTVSVLDLRTKASLLSVKSGAIQDVTLKESSVISSTTKLTGNLNLNGQTLTIKGDLIHTAGQLYVNRGKLIVEGDYRIQTPKDEAYTYSSGYLYMNQADDQVVVQGDFVTDSTQYYQGYLTAGILEIKGNFTQQSSHPSSQSNYNYRRNFFASGSHKVILSGNQAQQVSFQYPASGESHFNILELANSSSEGVQFATTVSVLDLRTKASLLSVKSGAIQDVTLKESSVISSTAKLTGNLNLNGQTLTIKGDLIHTAGQLYVNRGKLIVEGDYRIQTPKDEAYTYSSGYLYMNQADDQVVVQGDFVTDSTQSHQNYLTAGVLEIKGDLTQQSTHPSSQSNYNYRRNFFASGSHKVILSGNQAQQVSFQYPASGESHFNILEITNTSEQGIKFNTKIAVTRLFEHHRKPFTLAQASDFVDYDRDSRIDNVDPYPTDSNDTCYAVTEIPVAECENLLALYAQTNGDSWINKTGWKVTTHPCSWYGVSCRDGHVTGLTLHQNRLNGLMPPELGNLNNLEYLVLWNNQLRGNIPPELGNLDSLMYLYLGPNQLTGHIPAELGNLGNLEHLYLSNNQLNGKMPAELSNLGNLKRLHLNNNQLCGELSLPLSSLNGLLKFNFDKNHLTVSDPERIAFLDGKKPDWKTAQTPVSQCQ